MNDAKKKKILESDPSSRHTYTSIYNWLNFKYERKNYNFLEENKGLVLVASKLEKIF